MPKLETGLEPLEEKLYAQIGIVLFDFNVSMANQQLSLDETVCGKGTNLFLTPASEIQVHTCISTHKSYIHKR